MKLEWIICKLQTRSQDFLEAREQKKKKKNNDNNVAWFCIATLCDWLKTLAPLYRPIKTKIKTNPELHTRVLALGVGYFIRIGSRLACVYRVTDARGKFGGHEGSVRVARGNSWEQL